MIDNSCRTLAAEVLRFRGFSARKPVHELSRRTYPFQSSSSVRMLRRNRARIPAVGGGDHLHVVALGGLEHHVPELGLD